MKTLTLILNEGDKTPLYIQLYTYIRDSILNEDIPPGEKLPSLRALSKSLNVSLTTVELAYNQLLTEGYINSKPQSGYYVNSIPSQPATMFKPNANKSEDLPSILKMATSSKDTLYFDPICFDFKKWKACMNKVLNEYSHLIMQEGNPRGEAPLRNEISRYIYQSRGVRCSWDQVVIGAGTQQLISLLCIILNRMGIEHVSFESPGYMPVQSIFKNRGFKMTFVPLDKNGIQINKLPANIKSTVYVSPSNQFPTGSVMPVARRYALLDWAYQNDSIIIEDDYNSELRYSGRPVPSLQGLDNNNKVVYLGSFSSTLFPSIKISYMVMPTPMHELFEQVLGDYNQTCSKTEQLTLALYMEKGLYQTHLKKLRKLYSQKIQLAASAIRKYAGNSIRILNHSSGLHILLELKDYWDDIEYLCLQAKNSGLMLAPVLYDKQEAKKPALIFYYTLIPLEKMEEAIQSLVKLWVKNSNI